VERWELRTQDLRFRQRGPRETRTRIVIGAIAPSTLDAWREPILFWGPHYATAIRRARACGVGWIGLDVIPSVSARAGGDRARALALAGGKVVLSNERPGGQDVTNPVDALLFAHPEQGENLGFVDLRPERDGIVRHGAVFDGDASGLAPSFDAVLALR